MVALVQRRPVGIDAEDPAEIRVRHLEHALKIDVVGIEDAGARMLHRPHHAAHHAGRDLNAEEACAVVESVKAASDVYAPIGGAIIEGNTALADTPELVNQDPYGAGWLMRLRPAHAADVGSLMDAASYAKYLETEAS